MTLRLCVPLVLVTIAASGCGGSDHPGPTGVGGRGGGGGGGGMSMDGGPCPSVGGGTSGDPDATATWSKTFTISHWLGPDTWTGLAATVAVDSAERVYLTDAQSIFVADASGVQVLYPASQLAEDFGTSGYFVANLDISPDGRLFALVDLSSSEFTTAL